MKLLWFFMAFFWSSMKFLWLFIEFLDNINSLLMPSCTSMEHSNPVPKKGISHCFVATTEFSLTLASFPSPAWPQSFHGFPSEQGMPRRCGLRVGVLIFQHLPNFDLIPVHLILVIYLTVCSLEARCWTALGSFGLSSAQRCCGTSHGYPLWPCRTHVLLFAERASTSLPSHHQHGHSRPPGMAKHLASTEAVSRSSGGRRLQWSRAPPGVWFGTALVDLFGVDGGFSTSTHDEAFDAELAISDLLLFHIMTSLYMVLPSALPRKVPPCSSFWTIVPCLDRRLRFHRSPWRCP